ncbi:MAG: GNAT family N-acetyltransferase [Candidatus Zixiibacteriota bacterium]
MIQLKDHELTVRTLRPEDAEHLVTFSQKNAEFLYPSGLVLLPDDLTVDKWDEYIQTAAQELHKGTAVRFLIFHQDNGAVPIGKINYSQIFRGVFQACYLGYGIDKDYTGKGIMTRALQLTNEYMFNELNMHRIMANYMLSNLPSARVLVKLGFVKEGIAKDYLQINGKWEDHVLTSLTNPNWQEEGE